MVRVKRAPPIPCHQCRYFYITWDASFPYGCKAIGFKSKQLPQLAVYQNSGIQCLAFSQKPSKGRAPDGGDDSTDQGSTHDPH